jgi:sulfite exporter TauE/SafE
MCGPLALGVLFGLLGGALFLAGLQRWLSLAIGLVLLLTLFRPENFRSWLPVPILVAWLKKRMSFLLGRPSVFSIAALGMLNGLLPCGLVYVAAAAAAVTGNLLNGVGFMAAFGAGTVPMMLAISLGGRLVPVSFRLKMQRAVPAVVFVLAVLLIVRGLSLGIPYLSPDLAAPGSCCRKQLRLGYLRFLLLKLPALVSVRGFD